MGDFWIYSDLEEQFLNHQSYKAKQELLEDSSHLLPIGLLQLFQAFMISRIFSFSKPCCFIVYICRFRLLQTGKVTF